jgi:hypothetical protein
MLQGYELWLTDRDGRRAFRPAAAREVAEVIREARAMLAADAALREVAINQAGQQLMSFENAQPEA